MTMRNTEDLKPKAPTEFSPEYVRFCAKVHLEHLKIRHTAAMEEASIHADEVTRCEQYLEMLQQERVKS